MDKSDVLRAQYEQKAPGSYDEVVHDVIEMIADPEGYREPCAELITVIDHGDYQGTRLFVIAATGYQPSDYWYVKVDYGSCSGCDTFESIRGYRYEDGPTPEKELDGYMDLALHIVQRISPMQDEREY